MKLFIRKNPLIVGIILAAILGGIIGSIWPEVGIKMELPGKLFLNLLKMVVLPLIVVSVTLSMMKIDAPGKLGLMTLIYYTVTTALAVALGICIVTTLKPGDGINTKTFSLSEVLPTNEQTGLSEIAETIITPNIFKSASEQEILPLIVVSILFGIAFGKLGKENALIIDILNTTEKAIMKVVGWIITLTPLGIFALIAHKLGEAGGGNSVVEMITHLGKYFICVVLGLALHSMVILPLILLVFGRKNPISYAAKMSKTLLTAFSTASSSATLPLTMSGVVKEAKVSERVARFVLPLGATINMDGTALYEAVAAIFIAQSYGIQLGLYELIVVFITATLAAVGAAGIPEAGLVTMIIVLQAVGLPVEGMGIILAIDWLLDRFRTTVNVWGDSIGAAVLERLEN